MRRPRSTQRRLQRSQELPKASPDPPEAPTSLPKTSPKHSFAPFGAPGILKTVEFLKENNDFHFCVLSAPNALSEPQRAFPRRPKALRHYPQAFSGAPKSLSEPFSEFRWLGCSPFSLILKPHESQKRGKESVREQRLDNI